MIKLQFKKTQERIYLNGILIQGKEPEVKQPNAQDLLNEISKYDFTPRRGKLSSSSPLALAYNTNGLKGGNNGKNKTNC